MRGGEALGRLTVSSSLAGSVRHRRWWTAAALDRRRVQGPDVAFSRCCAGSQGRGPMEQANPINGPREMDDLELATE